MSGYNDFALVYDSLMQDADYEKRAQYLKELFLRYDRIPTLMLDFACGTGGFSLEFAKQGIEVIGADISEGMLSIAREKADKQNLSVMFLNQSGNELDLYGTVDGAICCLDSINHITNKNELKKALKNIALFLEKDRLFIFDVNTPYKHKKVLGNNTFVIEQDDIFCTWQNYLGANNTVDIYLDFFVNQNGSYTRYRDNFSERAYTDEELKIMLKNAGFEVLDVLGDLSFNAPGKNSQRNIYIAKRI